MSRFSWLRRLAHGFGAGFLLSYLQAPLGLDWTQLPVTQGSTAALFRAAALLGLALSLDAARPALRAGVRAEWFLALALGFATRGLGWDVSPGSRAGSALTLLIATLGLRWLAGPPARAEEAQAAPVDSLGRAERVGLFLAGLGSALALETLARELRLFTLGSAPGEAVLAVVFLLLLSVAAAAFGPLSARIGAEPARTAAGLALGGASSVAGLVFLAQLSPDGLHGYLRRFDVFLDWARAADGKLGGRLGLTSVPPLDGASIGTLWVTAILAAATLVGPAFLLGGTLGGCRHVGRLAHALIGAALGLLLLPIAIHGLARPLSAEEFPGVPFAWELVVLGATISALGAATVAIGSAQGKARVLASGAALLAALLPWCRPGLVLWSFSPWAPSPIVPELVLPSTEGLLTIEPARGGSRVVTLDRRRLTPTADEEEVDALRLRASFELLPAALRARSVRTLFIGQLTPARAEVLGKLGTIELERTAPWYASVPALETLLFRFETPPSGRIVSPAEARAKLELGEYDWVVAPPIHGPIVSWKTEAREIWAGAEAPHVDQLELRGEGVGVVWIGAEARTPADFHADRVLPVMHRFEELAYGVCIGREEDEPRRGWMQHLGRVQGPSALSFLCTMPQQREYALQTAWTAAAAAGPASGPLARGLALHFAAQKLSSPYETRAQQIELDEEELRAFLSAVPAEGPLDPFTRELWESLAWLFVAKRLPDLSLVFLEPVANRFTPWPALDQAVGRAYRELLEPESALPLFERVLASRPDDVDTLSEAARAASDAGDHRRAVGYLERALALQQGRRDLERARGLELMRAGDPAGRPIVEGFLNETLDDQELRKALEGEPPDAIPR